MGEPVGNVATEEVAITRDPSTRPDPMALEHVYDLAQTVTRKRDIPLAPKEVLIVQNASPTGSGIPTEGRPANEEVHDPLHKRDSVR